MIEAPATEFGLWQRDLVAVRVDSLLSRILIVQGTVEFLRAPSDRAALGASFIDKYGTRIEKRWGGRAVPEDRALFRITARRVMLYAH